MNKLNKIQISITNLANITYPLALSIGVASSKGINHFVVSVWIDYGCIQFIILLDFLMQ